MTFDLNHIYGDDLNVSTVGNLETVVDPFLTNQTVIRFILTNPGDDPFNPTFGLGSGRLIGQPNAASAITALIMKGLKSLSVIDQTQPIYVKAYYDDDGTLFVNLAYTDASTGQVMSQALPIG